MERKEVRNYRGFRKKPVIYGMSTTAFLIFVAVSVIALLSLLEGISWKKVIIVGAVIGVSYLIGLLLSAGEKIQEILYDEKLPTEFSSDE